MKTPLTLLAVGFALVAAACSGGGSDEAGLATLEAAAADTTPIASESAEVDAEAALMAFAQCMRDNGVADFPDPTVESDGSIGFGFVRGSLDEAGIEPGSEQFEAARETCNEHLESIALGRGGEGFDETELTDTLLAFAQCMRDNGVAIDDPDLSGFGEGPGSGPVRPFGDVDFGDPEVQEAFEICQEEVNLPGPGGGPGGGGRPGGGGGE